MANVANLNTTTTQAVDVPEVWASAVMRAREDNFVAAQLFSRKDQLVANKGDLIHFPEGGQASAVAIAEGGRLSDNLAAGTSTEKTIAIDKEYDAPFLVSNKLSIQSMYDEVAERYWEAGIAIAKQTDTDILALESGFSNTAVGTAASAIDNKTLTEAKETLDLKDVPFSDRFWILSPREEKDLLDLPGNYFTSMDFSNTKSLVAGQMGRVLLGSSVYFTNNLPAGKSIYAHKTAIGVAMQKAPKTEGENNLDMRGYLGNVSTLYGTGVLREDHGVTINRRA